MEFKKGQEVLCVKDSYMPMFIGTTWIVDFYEDGLCYCTNIKLSKEPYPFKKGEIAEPSSLLKELL